MPLRTKILIMLAASVNTAPARAETADRTAIDGRCHYPDRVTRYARETTLVLCDTVTIRRDGPSISFDFAQRSWGVTARFTGDVTGDEMRVSRIALRGGQLVAAAGECRIARRNDGALATISCLAKAGARSIAVNFVPSRV